MNEKLTYATMLEIPVNTCNITFKHQKKRRAKRKGRKINPEVVKEELLAKINSETDYQEQTNAFETQDTYTEQTPQFDMPYLNTQQDMEETESVESTAEVHPAKKPKHKRKFALSVVGVQVAVVFMLVLTIFMTNAFYTDSGINVFLRSVFGNTQQQIEVDNRKFDEFAPVLAVGNNQVTVADGVMTFEGKGSVYSPCDGKVCSIVQGEDGKFTIEIAHSENFKSVLTGIDFAYAGLEDTVYSNIPVGYITSGATMCFMGIDGTVISDYMIENGAVIWAV